MNSGRPSSINVTRKYVSLLSLIIYPHAIPIGASSFANAFNILLGIISGPEHLLTFIDRSRYTLGTRPQNIHLEHPH